MFTTGSKLFVGATSLALIGTLVYGITQEDSTLGVIGLLATTIALAFLTGINFWVRDCNVSAMDTAAIETCSAAQRAPSRSMWPLVGALGAAVIPVGLVVGRAYVWAGVIIIAAATVEWMVQAWSERASGDATYNAGVRRRVLHPLELPLLGAIGLGLIIFSFSRIMLWLPATAGAIAFGAIAASVLLFGALIASQRRVATSLVVVLCSLGAVGIVGAGVATAVAGGRHIDKHEVPSYEEGTCKEAASEADQASSRVVAAKSNMTARITLQNGQLTADVIGVNQPLKTVTIPRSLESFILFRNLDEGNHRLVASLGTEIVDAQANPPVQVEEKFCTQAVGKGGTQFMIISPHRPSAASEVPYTFTVPGINDAITIEVP